MGERKFRTVKVANLPDSKTLCTITNKPIILIIFVWAVFIMLLFVVSDKILLLPVAIYCLIMTFKEKVMIFSGHKDYFVIYHEDNKRQCDIYYLSEVRRWCFKQRLFNPSIKFFFQDKETVTLSKGAGSEIHSYLRKVMGDKEVQVKRQ